MSKPPYLMEDSVTSYNPKDHTHEAKGITFLASIFFFFICISILYILNHSSNTYTSLFNNNIFWFCMSNTLILIIAADYEAFSSSKEKQDLYEEYTKHAPARNYHYHVTSSYPKYEQIDEKSVIPPKQELPQEKKESVSDHKSESVPERVLEIMVQNGPKKSSSSEKKLVQDDDSTKKACEDKTLFPGRALGRSKSDRHGQIKRVVIDESKNRVRRAETMKVEEARVEEENNEFSSMSNEELNRRVEEFIQRFNRQIRLQAARNNMVHQA